jgi:hypothetical protein
VTTPVEPTTPATYPLKQIDARIAHQANSGPGILSPGRSFVAVRSGALAMRLGRRFPRCYEIAVHAVVVAGINQLQQELPLFGL